MRGSLHYVWSDHSSCAAAYRHGFNPSCTRARSRQSRLIAGTETQRRYSSFLEAAAIPIPP